MSDAKSAVEKPFDVDAVRKALYEMSYDGRLEKFTRDYIGEFDTGLKCNCGCAIIDKATPVYLKMGIRSAPIDRTFDSMPTVAHTYFGHDCGALYYDKCVEDKRGYVPRDKIPKEKPEEE